MPLTDCMGQTTYLQFRAWMYWLDSQWNQPGRIEHYLMTIAAEVRRVLSKKPKSISANDFKIKFDLTRGKSQTEADLVDKAKADAAKKSKATWFSWLGIPHDNQTRMIP